jgi:hypothetical protein
MMTAYMEALGRRFDLTAAPYSWPLGVGVAIEITVAGEIVGGVRVLCASDDSEFSTLVALAPADLCELALSRFVGNALPVTIESVLDWQNKMSAIGFTDVSPLISTFYRNHSPAEHAAHGT